MLQLLTQIMSWNAISTRVGIHTGHVSRRCRDHRLSSIYGIGNGIVCAIVPHSNVPETLPRILSAHKDLVKGHLLRTFD